jgi:short-subunit dehydrogenase
MGTLKKAAIGSAVVASAALLCTGTLAAAALTTWRKRSNHLANRVVLITGGSRGLGLAMAEEFGRKGARLALAARDNDELERARKLLMQRGVITAENEVLLFPSDLRNHEDAKELIRQTTAYFGQIDILVNNAGVITVGPVENQTVEDFSDVMNANFFSGLHCILSVLPQMLERKSGAIANIASIGGKAAVPHMLPYTASKFAVVGFSEGLNAELRSKGIRVTTVCPGLMRTGSHLRAQFKGNAEGEYRWFSLAASLPGISTSARSAARKIVAAVASGRSEIAITPQAVLISRFGNLLPAATIRAMELMALAFPPSVAGSDQSFRGADVRGKELTSAVRLGEAAARHYNQR